MSGGFWNYANNDLANELFGWNMSAQYGKKGFSQAQIARDINPMNDKELSEMIWDLLCLLHSKDYYESGDISESTYEEDLNYFKKKWFQRSNEDILNAYKNDLQVYADKLIKEFEKNNRGSNEE